MSEEELSRRWREEGERYVSALNAYVARGRREGWESVSQEEEPQETREPMAEAVLAAVRRANESGKIAGLRERFPPAQEPFVEMLEENGQSIPVALLLDDGRIVIRIGAPYEAGNVAVIDDLAIEYLPPEIITVGRSPQRNYFAIARAERVTIQEGWNGAVTAQLNWPTGLEGIPQGFETRPMQTPPIVTQLIPFDCGQRALFVGPEGIFVLAPGGARRLLPTLTELAKHFEWLRAEHPGDELKYDLSMEHAALSPDGKLIAAGHQSSSHYVFDAETLEIVAEIGNRSEYPHFAAFSSDSEWLALNSCHFYNGCTVGVATALLPGLKTQPYEEDERVGLLDAEARVYAAVFRKDEFVVGDAGGYLRAFDVQGNARWQHFIGSTIGDIDVSRDGKTVVATTYAGFVSILDMDTGQADAFTIGTSMHRERRRWLFWKKEARPLVW